MSFQSELKSSIDQLSEDEKEILLYDICLIANRGNSEDQKFIKDDILDLVNTRILKIK